MATKPYAFDYKGVEVTVDNSTCRFIIDTVEHSTDDYYAVLEMIDDILAQKPAA